MKDKIIIHEMKDPYEGADFDEVDYPRRLNYETIGNIEFDGVDLNDWPDFCDAFILSADMNGIEMCEEELEELNENKGYVYMKLIDKLF